MKLALIGITLMLFAFVSTFSHAGSERPLVGKYNYPGYAEPSVFESCEAFASGYIVRTVETFSQSGEEVRTVERFPLMMKVQEVEALVAAAKDETLKTTENNLCDMPSTSVTAFGTRELGPEGMLTLFQTGGCGEEHEDRSGPATERLIGIVSEHCPTTHR